VVIPAGRDVAAQADAAFPPGGRDDGVLDRVALHAVEGVRLVVLVEDADRQQEQAELRVLGFEQVALDVGLFELDLALLALAGDGVFEFHFREQARPGVELVPDEQHEAVKVDLVLALKTVPVHLAVAAEAGLVGPRWPARSGFLARLFHRLAVGGHLLLDLLVLGLQRGDFLLRGGELRLQLRQRLLDAVDRRRGVRAGRGCKAQQCCGQRIAAGWSANHDSSPRCDGSRPGWPRLGRSLYQNANDSHLRREGRLRTRAARHGVTRRPA
jgi:hypothetical protein